MTQSQKKYLPHFEAILGGALYAAGFPLFGTDFYLCFAPIIGFYFYFHALLKKISIRYALLITLLFSFSMVLTGYYWIPTSLANFWKINLNTSLVLSILSPFLILPHLFIFGFLIPIIIAFLKRKKFKNPGFINVFICSIFLILQYSIPKVFNAYPGHSWIQISPFLKPAQFFGEYVYTFFSILIALELATYQNSKKINQFNTIFIILFFLITFFFPITFSNQTKPLRLKIIQPNIKNGLLIDPNGYIESIEKTFLKYRELSQNTQNENIDLIIWPEGSYKRPLSNLTINREIDFMPKKFIEMVRGNSTPFLLSGFYNDITNNKLLTSNILISEKKHTQVYSKNILMPFGEKIPGPSWITSILKKYLSSPEKYTASNKKLIFQTTNKFNQPISFVSPICYEILFSEFIRDLMNSNKKLFPDLIINLSNDSWSENSAEVYQHFLLTKWRAIEFNKFFIRSTTTGFSAIVDPSGSELLRSNLLKEEILIQEIHPPIKPTLTLYQEYGFIPIFVLILFILIINLIFKKNYFPFSKSLGTPFNK